MLDEVYARLTDSYACTFDNESIKIDVGLGYVLTITHKVRNGCNIFTIISNKGRRPVNIVCPIDENGYSDIVPLYCFIDDFSSLL